MESDKTKPSIESLRQRLRYNPDTGSLTWAVDAGSHGRIKAGSEAGSINKSDGYRYIGLVCQDGKRRMNAAHRVAHAIVTGRWPAGEIDHRNSNRADNRWENLRDVSPQTNAENKTVARVDSSTGVQGVKQLPSGKYRAQIRVRGKAIHVGVFHSASDAHGAYLIAKRQMHAGCTI